MSLSQVVLDYYNGVMEKSGATGQMDCDTFKSIFRHRILRISLSLICFKMIFSIRLAFPERPEAKLDALIVKLSNVEKTSGTIRTCH